MSKESKDPVRSDKPLMMHVGQHLAARLSENTPKNIGGFYTEGITTCCHIIVGNRNKGDKDRRLVLTHGDAVSDLKKDVFEWLQWVNNGRLEPGFFIHLGEEDSYGYTEKVVAGVADFMCKEMPAYVAREFPKGITAQGLIDKGLLFCSQFESIYVDRDVHVDKGVVKGLQEDRSKVSEKYELVNPPYSSKYLITLHKLNYPGEYESGEVAPTPLHFDVDQYLPSIPLAPDTAKMLNAFHESVKSVLGGSISDSIIASASDDIRDFLYAAKDSKASVGDIIAKVKHGNKYWKDTSTKILTTLFAQDGMLELAKATGFMSLGSEEISYLLYPLNAEAVDKVHTKKPYVFSSEGALSWAVDKAVLSTETRSSGSLIEVKVPLLEEKVKPVKQEEKELVKKQENKAGGISVTKAAMVSDDDPEPMFVTFHREPELVRPPEAFSEDTVRNLLKVSTWEVRAVKDRISVTAGQLNKHQYKTLSGILLAESAKDSGVEVRPLKAGGCLGCGEDRSVTISAKGEKELKDFIDKVKAEEKAGNFDKRLKVSGRSERGAGKE